MISEKSNKCYVFRFSYWNIIVVSGIMLFSLFGFSFGQKHNERSGYLYEGETYYSLTEVFESIGFNPNDEDCWTFVTAGDIHYNSDGTSRGGSFIIDQILQMNPTPDLYLIPGDIVNHMSLSMASVPSPGDVEIAIEEFKQAKKDLDRLSPDIPYYLALGNHDTYPYEYKEPGGRIFNQIFSDYHDSVNWFFKYKGVHFFILDNGSHSNYNIGDQIARAKEYYKSCVKPYDPVIVVQHFPYVGQNYLTSFPNLLHTLFDNHYGTLWNIVGHNHIDMTRVYEMPHTQAIENIVSKGYTLYCMKSGKVIARILHPREKGLYTLLHMPEKPEGKVLHPFEDVHGVVWKAVIGTDIGTINDPNLIDYKANDGETNWVYTHHLTYKFPFLFSGKNPNAFALMAHEYFYSDNGKIEYSENGKVFGSFDQKEWIEMPYKENIHNVAIYAIPEVLKKGETNIYIKIIGPCIKEPHPAAGRIMDNIIGGFAFINQKD